MKHKLVQILYLLVISSVAISTMTLIRAQQNGFTETFDNPSLPGWEVNHASVTAFLDCVADEKHRQDS